MAVILIAYALTSVISFPTQTLSVQLPGFLFKLNINMVTIISVLVAVLTAAGSDWMISEHPYFNKQIRWQHWLIPGLTALVIGVPLDVLRVSPAWWGVFALGGVLLAGVLLSEYISVDPGDSRSPIAILSLTAVSLALFLTLAIAVRGSGSRLYLILAALIPASFLVTSRYMMLRTGEGIEPTWAIGITILILQFATGLYYLPLRPIQFGLLLLGIQFGLNILAVNYKDHKSQRKLWLEPALITSLFAAAAFIA
jgi:hypothetical protein